MYIKTTQLILILFCFISCVKQRTLIKYDQNIKKLNDLLQLATIDSVKSTDLEKVIKNLIDNKSILSKYTSGIPGPGVIGDEQNAADIAVININSKILELVEARDFYEIIRKDFKLDTFRRKCLT